MSKYIGPHTSASGGAFNAAIEAKSLKAKAFALFTKSQKQWSAKPLTSLDIKNFEKELKNSGISPDYVLPHDSYLINMGNPEEEMRTKSKEAFLEEMKRVEALGLKLLNFHPGSHLKKISIEESLDYVAEGVQYALDNTKSAIAVIETTAGQGTNLGFDFKHLKRIIDAVSDKKRVGVCIDTCHIFAAGYDIRTEDSFNQTMDLFDKEIGFEYLKGMHLNDSKTDFKSKVDRHESLGKGFIGIDAFKFIMNDSRFDNIPLILETPDETIWADEIKMLYSFIK